MDERMDYENGVLLLNLIADFWDLKAQYDVLHPSGRNAEMKKRNAVKQTNPHKPSCSVLIKYLKEKNDIIFAHNTWHEYRAMGYR